MIHTVKKAIKSTCSSHTDFYMATASKFLIYKLKTTCCKQVVLKLTCSKQVIFKLLAVAILISI